MTPAVRYWRESAVPHSFWEPNPHMPRIPDTHLQSVVFIYPSVDAAAEGLQVGGSGFVVNFRSGVGPWRIRYVVTNQHVLDDGGYWVRLNRVGGMHVVHIPEEHWIRSPEGDDFAIAVLPLPENVVPFELSLDLDPGDTNEPLALTRDEVGKRRVGPGDEAYMVGRFAGHGGRLTNNPIARFGSISLMPNPNEPVEDGRGKLVEAYLIEMRSHGGFSGAPVFLLIPWNTFRGEIGWNEMDDMTTRFRLLGVDTGHKFEASPVEQKQGGEWKAMPGLRVPHNSDVAIVTPIWKVIELLEREDVAMDRRKRAEELQRRRGSETAASDTARLPEGEASLTRGDFENALRKVSRRVKPSQAAEGTSGTSE